MTPEELEAIDKFQYFKEGDIITKDMIKNKEIVMDLILKLQRELEEYKTDKTPDMLWPKIDLGHTWDLGHRWDLGVITSNPYTIKFNRRRCYNMNTAISILMTFLLGVMTVKDFAQGKYIFGCIFLVETLLYIFWVIPLSVKNDKRDKKLKEAEKEMKAKVKEAEKIIENNS